MLFRFVVFRYSHYTQNGLSNASVALMALTSKRLMHQNATWAARGILLKLVVDLADSVYIRTLLFFEHIFY